MRLGLRLLLPAALGFALISCDDTVITQIPPPQIQVDVLTQKPSALVDILWVVDNSGTMVQEQAALAANFDQFIAGLTTCLGTGVDNDLCDFETRKCLASGAACNPPDYHIGVISTDVRSSFDSGRLRRVGVCTTAPGATPSMDKYRYCLNSNDECVHQPGDPLSDPANVLCDMSQAVAFVTASTPGAAEAFSRAVRVGTSGSGRETGIEAAAAALGRATDLDTGRFIPAPTENEGFLRPDASLFIIFVSDEDDSSFGEPTYYYRAFETLKGAGNEGLVSISAIVGDPDADGEAGTRPGGCEVPNPNGGDPVRNSAGTRYVSLAMYSRGLSAEFRVCDEQRLKCPAGQICQLPVEGLAGVCVPDRACSSDLDCGNFQCSEGRGCISCVEEQCRTDPDLFLELLEQNGVFGSICAPDYGRVLTALAFEAAGLDRKFGLTATPNCFGEPVACCAQGTPDEQCTTTTAMCVRVDGQPVANDRAGGWVYDIGGNAVFFDGQFVPQPQSEVRISYRSTSSDDNSPCGEVLQ